MLACAACEVEQQILSADLRPQSQHKIALCRLEHIARFVDAVWQRADAGSHPALCVVEHRRRALPQAPWTHPIGERGEADRADPVGGELGAQIGTPLLGMAHARDDPLDVRARDRLRRDHDALLRERDAVRRHRAWHASSDVGVVRSADGEADELPLGRACEHWRDHGDVRQVRAAGERIVEDPGDSQAVALVKHGGERIWHRAEVDRDVLGLRGHLAVGVEQGGRAVPPLLDVRRVRRSDEHGAHLLVCRSERA